MNEHASSMHFARQGKDMLLRFIQNSRAQLRIALLLLLERLSSGECGSLPKQAFVRYTDNKQVL
jgi:hypothetical protein